MLAPAGFFCTACPTVIILEEMIAGAVKAGFHFQGVVGIDNLETHQPDLFVTWNGKKPVYIFDENEQCLGLETVGAHGSPGEEWGVIEPTPHSKRDWQKLKHKRKLAKEARKRNRRK